MKFSRSPKRMGLAVLSGGLAFVGCAQATEIIVDGSFESAVTTPQSAIVKVGGLESPDVGQGWSTFSTYLYSTQYTMPGPANSGLGFLRPYASGASGVTRSAEHVQQRVSLTSGTSLTNAKIDGGQASYRMSAWFSTYLDQNDWSDMTLEFLDDNDQVVGDPVALGGQDFVVALPFGSNSKFNNAREFGQDVRTGTIPAGARRARVSIQSVSAGNLPDGYVDNVSLDVAESSQTGPVVSSAVPANNAVGAGPVINLSVTIEDRATAVNTNSIQLFLDSALVTPIITKVETNTFVKFNAGVLQALSPHSYRIIFADNAATPVKQTNNFAFTVADYLTLPTSLRTPLGTEDTTKPGFNVFVYQLSQIFDTPAVQANTPGSIAFAESMLAGLAGDNFADLSGAASSNRFDVPTVINWINTTGVSGNFGDDTGFPGIPGIDERNFVDDIRTYARFPTPGYYQMGVTSDDHFRVTAATSGVQTLRITSPTNMVIPAVPIATNITQLQFGAPIPNFGLGGQVVYATPSGDPETSCDLTGVTGLAGKIVLLDIGGTGCTSSAKVLQAQQAGALAVIAIRTGDFGYPSRLDDQDTSVTIPVVVIAEAFGGAKLKELVTSQATPVNVTLQTDTNPRLSEWDAPKGFGAVDVPYGFAVAQAGVYPLRLVAGQLGGNASLEWYMINDDGSKTLLNDTNSVVKTFRALGAIIQFNPPTLAGGNVTLSWVGTGALQETTALPTANWIPSANQNNPQTVPASGSGKFYRLAQ